VQVEGDYRESWQPQAMSETALARSREIATAVTDALGGRGIFGVERFIRGDEVLFSEVSPRPHDTGMVTMATQALSEFALHVRAILGLAVPEGEIPLIAAGASAVVLAEAEADSPLVEGATRALAGDPEVDLRLFGKPDSRPGRRMGVLLATGPDTDSARARARSAASSVSVR
jgi:phosphoribosylglycinamide formyltransferase 2